MALTWTGEAGTTTAAESSTRGTDILLRNFRVQDSGVTVVAAAAGEVSLVHDGEPDRHAVQSGANDWNVVHIAHSGVSAGTPLGLVGSSGISSCAIPPAPWSRAPIT